MATFKLAKFTQIYADTFLVRRSLQGSYVLSQKFSTNDSRRKIGRNEAVPYIGSAAANLKIADTLKLDDANSKPSKLKAYVAVASMAVFMIYFFILREENDIDEILSGNNSNDIVKLYDLRLRYQYCKNNKLPTEKIEKKIDELCKKLNRPNY